MWGGKGKGQATDEDARRQGGGVGRENSRKNQEKWTVIKKTHTLGPEISLREYKWGGRGPQNEAK